jgi:hypothetical protein
MAELNTEPDKKVMDTQAVDWGAHAKIKLLKDA